MITTVTGKNQITIPAALARKLRIESGQQLDWHINADGELVARLLPKRGDLARQAAGMGREWLDEGQDPVADLVKERSTADKEEGLE